MKTKSKKLLVLLATIILMFNLSSCNKYPEGPWFSLKSKTARLTGTWKIVEGLDNNDVDVYYTFEKDGDYILKYSYGNTDYSAGGEWNWGAKKKSIIISFDGPTDDQLLIILRLTSSEFWFKDDDGDEYKAEKQ